MTKKCSVCGCTEFVDDVGTKICSECGAHVEQFVDVVDECDPNLDLFQLRFLNSFSIKTDKQSELRSEPVSQKSGDSTWSWTTFEAFNIILKCWTDILVHHGLSENFEAAVLNLWMAYLQKQKIAFIPESESVNWESDQKFGFLSLRDMVVLKNTRIKERKKKRKKCRRKTNYERFKTKLSTKKRKGATTDKNISMVVSFMNKSLKELETDESATPNKSLVNAALETSNFESTVKEEEINSGSEDEVSEVASVSPDEGAGGEAEAGPNGVPSDTESDNELTCRTKLKRIHGTQKFDRGHMFFLDIQNLIAFLYLAILISGEDFLLMDLLRWFREGHIPYFSAVNLLPDSMRFSLKDWDLFNFRLPSSHVARMTTGSLAERVAALPVPMPSFARVARKLIAALKLPTSVLKWLKCVLELFGPMQDTVVAPALEQIVGAAIIVVFKTMFVMDGVHEEILSDWADKLNAALSENREDFRLFSFRKWHNYMCRLTGWLNRVEFSKRLMETGDTAAERDSNPETKRFAQHFWSRAAWMLDRDRENQLSTDDKEAWDVSLFNAALKLNGSSVENLMSTAQLFRPGKIALQDAVSQYLDCGYEMDASPDRDQIKEEAEKLNGFDFDDEAFDWPVDQSETCLRFRAFGQQLRFVSVPLSNRMEAGRVLHKSETFYEEKSDQTLHVVIPDVLSSYWELNDREFGQFHSFRWLVKLVGRVLESTPKDVLNHVKKIENIYIKSVKRK